IPACHERLEPQPFRRHARERPVPRRAWAGAAVHAGHEGGAGGPARHHGLLRSGHQRGRGDARLPPGARPGSAGTHRRAHRPVCRALGPRRAGRLAAMDPFGAQLPTLETPRLRLRHVREADVEALLAVFGDPEALRYWGHGPLADLAAARAYVRQMEAGFASRSLFQWVVADREGDGLIGTVTLFDWNRDHRRAEIGFMLGRAHWGQGFAQEAVRAALRFGFDAMD